MIFLVFCKWITYHLSLLCYMLSLKYFKICNFSSLCFLNQVWTNFHNDFICCTNTNNYALFNTFICLIHVGYLADVVIVEMFLLKCFVFSFGKVEKWIGNGPWELECWQNIRFQNIYFLGEVLFYFGLNFNFTLHFLFSFLLFSF